MAHPFRRVSPSENGAHRPRYPAAALRHQVYAHMSSGCRILLKGGLGLGCRGSSAQVRKIPVTVEMLRWLRSNLLDGGRDQPEAAALWSAMCLGWFFTLKASEYLPPLELSGAPPRVLKGRDLEFFRDGDVRCSVCDYCGSSPSFDRQFYLPALSPKRPCPPEPALA